MKAQDLLPKVVDVLNQRGKEYSTLLDGHEERNMSRIVEVFNALTNHRYDLSTHDGYVFMQALKLVRIDTRGSEDDYVDLMGYCALAGEERLNRQKDE